MKPKFCKDCKWCEEEPVSTSGIAMMALNFPYTYRCTHENAAQFSNLVTGEAPECSKMRNETVTGCYRGEPITSRCYEAKWFEPKEEK